MTKIISPGIFSLLLFVIAASLFSPKADAMILQPELRITSGVADVNGGALVANDIIEYTFTVTSTGDDSATLVVFTDSIPANTSYVSGSMKIDGVAKSDGALNDQAEYSGITSKVTFRLGTLATALAGGTLLPNDSTVVKFRVRINSGASSGTAISNQASATYGGTVVVDTRTAFSDSDPNAPGSQISTIFVNTAPPNIQLMHGVSPTGTQLPATDLTYNTIFTNSGGSQAQGFNITEPISANTYFKINSATANLGTTGLSVITQYSNNGMTFVYTPVSGGGGAPSGYDGNVTHIRFVFTGLLSRAAPNNTGTVNFTARIR